MGKKQLGVRGGSRHLEKGRRDGGTGEPWAHPLLDVVVPPDLSPWAGDEGQVVPRGPLGWHRCAPAAQEVKALTVAL